jgi:hypothetical protein
MQVQGSANGIYSNAADRAHVVVTLKLGRAKSILITKAEIVLEDVVQQGRSEIRSHETFASPRCKATIASKKHIFQTFL